MLNRPALALLIIAATFTTAGYSADDGIRVEYNPDTERATVDIPSSGGLVAWSDLIRGLARAKGFDDTALEGILPPGSINLDAKMTSFILMGMNLALIPHIQIYPRNEFEPVEARFLRIVLDRKALFASERWLKERLREALRRAMGSKSNIEKKSFELTLDPGWEQAPLDRPLAVLVHGLHSSPVQAFVPFDEELRNEGFPVGVVRYPNDQAIDTSARMLSEKLREVAEQQPERKVSLVTTSMGGLVSRAAIENPDLYPGNVRQLIMVAPPTHGSLLAEFAFALEIWEHIGRDKERKAAQLFYSTIEDGLGEAYADLTPGSDLLERLNSRPRNPKVSYSLFLGSGGYLTEGMLKAARRKLKQAGQANRFVRFFGPRLDATLADLEEVQWGKGDGAVAIKRGRLEGVEDTMILPFNHLTMVKGDRTPAQLQLRREIIKRLKAAQRSTP